MVAVYFMTVYVRVLHLVSLFVAYDLTMFVVAAATPFLCGWFHERYPIASGVMVLLRFVY